MMTNEHIYNLAEIFHLNCTSVSVMQGEQNVKGCVRACRRTSLREAKQLELQNEEWNITRFCYKGTTVKMQWCCMNYGISKTETNSF